MISSPISQRVILMKITITKDMPSVMIVRILIMKIAMMLKSTIMLRANYITT